MRTLAARRRFFLEGAVRASEFWLGYVQCHRRDPQALSAEQDNILQAIAACQVYSVVWQIAADLALHFHPHMMYTGQWALWEQWLTRLLEARSRDSRSLTVALLQRALGEVLARQGKWMESVRQVEQAVTILRQAGEPQLLARSLVDLAQWYFNLDRWRETEDLAREAQNIASPAGDRTVIADAFILRGRLCLGRGQPVEAIRHFESALEPADEGRHKAATNFLGQVYLQLDQPDEALPYFHKALEIAREEADRPGQGVILNNMGAAYLKLDRLDLALACLEESLTITRETDNRPVEAMIVMRLGQVHLALEQNEQALRYFTQALKIACEVGDSTREVEIQQAIMLARATD